MDKITVKIGDKDILPKPSVRNLGVDYYELISMESHVQHVCRTVHMHLRGISRVRRYLPEDAAHLLVHAMTISRID